MPASFPPKDHDHRRCLAETMTRAEEVCRGHKARLTPQRREILAILAASHQAIGAYDILAKHQLGQKSSAPVTVYRALDFLMEHGLVHRLASLNAYVVCRKSEPCAGSQFFVCKECQTVVEFPDDEVTGAIQQQAALSGFTVMTPVVEVRGLCPSCQTP